MLLGILVGKGVAEIRVVQICHAHHSRLFPIPSFIHTCAHSLIKGEAVSHPRLAKSANTTITFKSWGHILIYGPPDVRNCGKRVTPVHAVLPSQHFYQSTY